MENEGHDKGAGGPSAPSLLEEKLNLKSKERYQIVEPKPKIIFRCFSLCF
jgi:hypothetical protein